LGICENKQRVFVATSKSDYTIVTPKISPSHQAKLAVFVLFILLLLSQEWANKVSDFYVGVIALHSWNSKVVI